MQNLQIIETNKKEEYAHKFQKLQGLEEKKIQENNRKLKDKLKGLEATKSRIRVQLADEAHKKLTDEIGLHRKKLDNELKRQFALRMNSFVIVQKQKQEREVEQKVKELRDALEKQRKSNDELARRLAEKSQFLEKQKKSSRQRRCFLRRTTKTGAARKYLRLETLLHGRQSKPLMGRN